MFTTITGKKLRIKKDATDDEIKDAVNNKLGTDRDKIFIYKNIIGFFNCKEAQLTKENIFKEYGVPDKIFNSTEKKEEFLDYKRGRIVKEKKKASFLGCADSNLTSRIFKHLLCEDEEQEQKQEEEEEKAFDIEKLVEIVQNDKQTHKVSEKDKQLICDHMEEIVDRIFP
ncbi:uncharacterized protein VNE69_01295 [Vairimorpha necatrix]|uniref:Ubiquitin-like domain-containing protein n=1 Tax=Vairimorpha necatrix TaxID=6039 RepID=A0AAX4J8Z9_9MICR